MRDAFNRHSGQLAMSAITLVELLAGEERSESVARNHVVVDDFCSRLIVLPYGDKAGAHYGGIRAALERRGQSIGVNDLHIAAHASTEGLTLVSNNLREFERVPGLLFENWLADAAA